MEIKLTIDEKKFEINEPTEKKAGGPKDPTKRKPEKTSQIGTKNDETRATFIVKKDTLRLVKSFAHWERRQIKDVVNNAPYDYVYKVISGYANE